MTEETEQPQRKLVLIDAYSLLFRAFFAGRYLSTSDNRPTGALFGFTNMLLAILASERPDSVVVCWDAPERTHRKAAFEAYKAHRPEADPQLVAQMPIARQIVEAFGMQSAELGGYEADDLIGTLADRGAREGFRVVVVTGDSDALQLVSDRVSVEITQRGVSDVKTYDPPAVVERFGVPPERIPDWKALVGDTSDNIPGVSGIGPKKATTLLQQWGTLDALLERLDDVTPAKLRDALDEGMEKAKLSRRLATIDRDAPVDLKLKPYAPTPSDWRRVREIFADLEFKSLLSRIPGEPEESAPLARRERAAPDTVFAADAIRIESAAELTEAIATAQRVGTVAIQIETDASLPMRARLTGLAFAAGPNAAYYVAVSPPLFLGAGVGASGDLFADAEGPFQASLDDLRPLLEDERIAKIGHNVKVAEILFERGGLHPSPFVFDTLIAAYLLNAGRSSYPLMDLAEAHLHVRLEAADAFAPDETLAQQAALIFALADPLRAALAAAGLTRVFETLEIPLVPVLSRIEQTGIAVDARYLARLSAVMAEQLAALAKEIFELAGEEFNIGSPKQLQSILFGKLQLPTGKKIKSGFSTGADLLEQLAPKYDIARKILEHREISKLKSTYADALPRLIDPGTGRIHTSLNQTVASTGRLSSSDPNLQNIPVRNEVGREIRRAFVAPRGHVLLSCDYSQIELRILAHVTREPALLDAFEKNEDIHAATAANVFSVPLDEVTPDMRRQAKTINFAVIYGQSGFSLANVLGVDPKTANTWIRDYFARMPGVERYVEETKALAHRQKWVSTLLGRRRYVPEIDSGNHQMKEAAERAAVNMPIQGSAADIIKQAMIDVHRYLATVCESDCRLILQVHDELLFEVEEGRLAEVAPEIIRLMESAFPLVVPVRADAKSGPNWADTKPLRLELTLFS
jgi:DNA polymerase-1